MTREELKDYVEEQRNLDTIPYDVYSTLIDGIDTLEQESMLDKIRTEIKHKTRIVLKNTSNDDWAVKWNECIEEVLEVIDRYRAENEE